MMDKGEALRVEPEELPKEEITNTEVEELKQTLET